MYRQLLLVALVVTAAACSDSGAVSTTSTVMTQPADNSPISTFPDSGTGTLTKNGAATFSFGTTVSGPIVARLITLTPNDSVGLWLGTYDGSYCAYGSGKENAIQYDPNDPDPEQPGRVNAFAPSSGSYCVRIYDANGTASGQTYQIAVTHP